MRLFWQSLRSNSRLTLVARAAASLVLLLLLLAIWWPSLVAVVQNNLGSLALNRTLLAPEQTSEERLATAVRAGQRFQNALSWNPLSGLAYHNLATIYDAWADGSSAARALSRAAALMPRDAVTQLKHGMALARRGRETGALQAWRAAGADTYFIQRGKGEGDPELALRHYERAVAIDPGNAEAQLELGRALSRLGRKEEALAAFAAAAEADRGDSERPHLLQAEIHVARGEWTAALAAYRDAAERSPGDPEPHYRRGSLLNERLGEDEAAMVAFRQALQADPGHEPSRLALGRLEVERGACDAAEGWLGPLLRGLAHAGASSKEVEKVARLRILLGECWVEQGHRSRALAHLGEAEALSSQDPATVLRLGQAYARAGRYENAIATYLRVLELAPGNQEARRALEELGYDGYSGTGTTGGE